MLMLYSAFKEKYKYIGEYSPNNNNLFQIGVISTLIPGTFFYICFDEIIIKSLFAMILFVMFIINIIAIFDFLIKDKDNANLYKIIFCFLFLFFIVTVIVAFMIVISIKNVDFTKLM